METTFDRLVAVKTYETSNQSDDVIVVDHVAVVLAT